MPLPAPLPDARPPLRSLLLAAALLAGGLPAVHGGDIYGYTDDQGVLHLTDVPSGPRPFRLILRSRDARPAPPAGPGGQAGRPFAGEIAAAASRFRLDPALLHAVITVESGYNPDAVSPKGAMGLMQLIPDTARRYGVANPRAPEENLRGGAQYLRDLLTLFDDNLQLALAAYNAGEQAVLRHGSRIPPFPETRDYVRKVEALYWRLR
ncbi:MAG: lytic transglycosylase domain-containing protein [Pseudomonadota bacterium]